MEADAAGIERAVIEASHLLEGLQTREGAGLEPGQSIHQPAPVHPDQGSHVGNGADAEQIAGIGQALLIAHGEGQGLAQDVGQAHPGQAPVGGALRCTGRMEQGQKRRKFVRKAVVVGEDHIEA